MLMRIARFVTNRLLRLRYRIIIKGYEEIAAKGKEGVLFLPNHPAMIDPVILSTILYEDFKPHALIDETQLQGKLISLFKKRMRLLPMTDLNRVGGCSGIDHVKKQLQVCADTLRQKGNLLFYPAGRLYHSQYEELRSNRGVKELFAMVPDVRVVLVRTTGLWGSSFSLAHGVQNSFDSVLTRNIKHLLLNALFFVPKRQVTVTFQELPDSFPRHEERQIINRQLEKFYNCQAYPNTFVPYYWWQGNTPRHLREPETICQQEDIKECPEEIRQKVLAKLMALSGKSEVLPTETLHCDLGLDSLNVAELTTWIQSEFAYETDTPENLRTVGSVMLAAIGQAASSCNLKEVDPAWYLPQKSNAIDYQDTERITDIFLRQARMSPMRILMADQQDGIFTVRRMVGHLMTLVPELKRFKESYLGILLPASANANISFLATLFAGKTPVMINWTTGARNMRYVLDSMALEVILTSKEVIGKLSSQGMDFSTIQRHFIFLEDILYRKPHLRLLTRSSFALACMLLSRRKIPDTAVVLFTSGSENHPKAVPLTHHNLISDLKSSVSALGIKNDDTVLGIAPPFHTLGVWLDFLFPDVAGIRIVYHGNPMEGQKMAKMIELYQTNVLVGTPTFIACIYGRATAKQLESVRLIAMGAEACPSHLVEKVEQKTPQVLMLEGYGITECAAVLTVNTPASHKNGTLGHPIHCIEWTVREEDLTVTPSGSIGMLYVRGPNVFSGYLHYHGPSPFVEIDGRIWYRTGDLVSLDENNFLVYRGRLSRFVKIAGEMISLPAIENVLADYLEGGNGCARTYAIVYSSNSAQPVITLMTTCPRKCDEINDILSKAGMSPIHFIRKIIVIPEIPLLGTGKTDYRKLNEMLAEKLSCAA